MGSPTGDDPNEDLQLLYLDQHVLTEANSVRPHHSDSWVPWPGTSQEVWDDPNDRFGIADWSPLQGEWFCQEDGGIIDGPADTDRLTYRYRA